MRRFQIQRLINPENSVENENAGQKICRNNYLAPYFPALNDDCEDDLFF
jgi:hypothetical protein